MSAKPVVINEHDETDLRLAYVFAADAFADVEYVFGAPASQGSARDRSG